MELNNIIFSIFLLLFGYYTSNYILKLFHKSKFNYLADNDYLKPQAFHDVPIYRLGGAICFFLLILVFTYLSILKNIFILEYLSFATLFFILGFIDDLKIKIAPKFRLLVMVGLLVFLVIYNKIYIEKTGLEFLNNLLEIDIFSLIFICICFLFIINGSNFIDGFNGLLGIHALMIFVILFGINLLNENYNMMYILFFISLITLLFITFNFPKAKIFLGDGGAYLFGILIALSSIKTSILNPSVSPFFFGILLFYIFFEVFFSFFRKLLIVGQSPLLPDREHLHMLLYKFLLKKNKEKLQSNYTVSIYINSFYFLFMFPAFVFMHDGLFCRYYFFFLLILYIYFYRHLLRKLKL